MFCLAMDMSLKNVNHLSLNNHLVLLLKLLFTENKLKQKHGHEKKLEACVKSAKENG